MKIECARSDYDHNISLLISFSGWLVLLGYLFYLYLESSGDLVSLILASGESTRAQYTLLILFAPLISSILGYVVNRRILQYQEKYLKANQFKDMARRRIGGDHQQPDRRVRQCARRQKSLDQGPLPQGQALLPDDGRRTRFG